MASAYDGPLQYAQIAPALSNEDKLPGMQYRQTQSDQGYALADSYAQAFANLPIEREVGKQYLDEKVKGLNNTLTSLTNADYGDPQVVSRIMGAIDDATDPILMKEVMNTVKLQQDAASIRRLRDSGDERYSATNEAYAMQEANRWLKSTDLKDTYGGMTYHDYVDVNKEWQDAMKNLQSSEQEYDIIHDNGRKTRVKVKELSPERIRAMAIATMSPKAQMQLTIDGWANYSQATPDEFRQVVGDYRTNNLAKINGSIAELELQKKSGDKSPLVDDQINLLKEQRNNLFQQSDAMERSPERAWATIELANRTEKFTNAYSYSNKSVTQESDVPYWNRVNANFRQQELGLAREKFNLDVDKENYKRGQDKKAELATGAITASVLGDDQGKLNEIYTNPDKLLEHTITLGQDRDNAVKEAYSALSSTDRTLFDNIVNKKLQQNPNMDPAAVKMEVLRSNFSTNPNALKAITKDNDLQVARAVIDDIQNNAKDLMLNNTGQYAAFAANDSNLQLVYPTASGEFATVPAKAWLNKQGLILDKDGKDSNVTSNPTADRVIKMNLLADAVVNSLDGQGDRSAADKYVQELGKLFGENVTIEDIEGEPLTNSSMQPSGTGLSLVPASSSSISVNPNSQLKTAQFLRAYTGGDRKGMGGGIPGQGVHGNSFSSQVVGGLPKELKSPL